MLTTMIYRPKQILTILVITFYVANYSPVFLAAPVKTNTGSEYTVYAMCETASIV